MALSQEELKATKRVFRLALIDLETLTDEIDYSKETETTLFWVGRATEALDHLVKLI